MKKCADCSREIRAYFVRCQHCGGLPARENLLALGLKDSLLEESLSNHQEHERLQQANVFSRQQEIARRCKEQQQVLDKLTGQVAPSMGIYNDIQEARVKLPRDILPPLNLSERDEAPLTYRQSPGAEKIEEMMDSLCSIEIRREFVVEDAQDFFGYTVATKSHTFRISEYSMQIGDDGSRSQIIGCAAAMVKDSLAPGSLPGPRHFPFRRMVNEKPQTVEIEFDLEENTTIFNRYQGARIALQTAMRSIESMKNDPDRIAQGLIVDMGLEKDGAFMIPIRFAREAAEMMMAEIL